MKARLLPLAAAAAACALSLSSCGGGSTTPSGSDTAGTLRIGIKFDQPGLGLKQGSEYTGFDVDVARYIAKELGKEGKIEFKEAPTPQREVLIETGQVDYIVGTYSITDARKQKVSFAGPYFVAGQDLLVRSTDTNITGPESLTGKKLCSVKGSTPAKKVKDLYPQTQLQEYDTYSKCVEELAADTIDAVTTDNTILAGYASQPQYAGKLRLVGKTFSTENYGVGLKKGDTAMCQKITDALNKMITSGEWQQIVTKNFGPAGFKVDTKANPPKPAACA
ncbi:MAG TPA: glutamate ABC transporter substrate-binding protein [Dermatophilaceae bacterium]|nr:glutamate ABC transporter substrate-binding protein [Dermatophilaceae bacterium]